MKEIAAKIGKAESMFLSPAKEKTGFDLCLVAAVFTLLAISIAMVYSASAFVGLRMENETLYLKKQIVWICLGLLVMSITALIDYRAWIRWIYPLLFLSFLGLVFLFVPGLGMRVNGALRWYHLGVGNLQPSEIAKLVLILYLGYSLAKKGEKVKRFSVGFLPTSLVAGLFVALILLQPDLGTSAVLGLTTLVMMIVAGSRISFLLFGAVAAVPVLYHELFAVEWRAKRLLAFRDPWAYEHNVGYQLTQSLKALGSGGIEGVGLGESKVKLGFLPEAHTDFVVPILGEELGFIGLCFLIILFLIIVWRGFRIAWHCPDRYGSLIAVGITTWFCCQALINLSVVTGLLPTKGLTLPFVSYGGSSMISCMAALGILLNVSAMDPPPLPKET